MYPNGGSYNGAVSVTVQPPDTNAMVYYTVDGSLPTTNSFVYSGAIEITNSVKLLNANAFEAGYNNSVAVNAQFTIVPGVYFTSPGGFITNGGFQILLSGTPAQNYILQASTDLIYWQPIVTNLPSFSPFSLTDTNATNFPERFYRAVQGN